MTTTRNNPPAMRHHKGTGQAYVRISGRQIYLGAWGSAKAQRAYRDLVASWATTGGLPVPAGADLRGMRVRLRARPDA